MTDGRQLHLKQYSASQASYLKALELIDRLTMQRYLQALAIYVEFNDEHRI